MTNALFNKGEWGDIGTITTNSADASFPITNLLQERASTAWKSTTDTGVFIEINRAAANWDTLGLLFSNLTSAATWRIRGGDSQAEVQGVSADVDSGTITAWAQTDMSNFTLVHSIFHITAPSNDSWIRIDINDAANPDGFLLAGRLMIGEAYEPTINYQFRQGNAIGISENPLRGRAIANTLFIEQRQQFMMASLVFDHIPQDEFFTNFQDIHRQFGNHKPLMLLLDVDDNTSRADKMIYGVFDRVTAASMSSLRRYRTAFTMSEFL